MITIQNSPQGLGHGGIQAGLGMPNHKLAPATRGVGGRQLVALYFQPNGRSRLSIFPYVLQAIFHRS